MTESELIQATVRETLRQMGVPIITHINQAEAFRMYGRGRVSNWIKEGWLHPVCDRPRGKKRILVSELEQVVKSNNVLNKFKLSNGGRYKKHDKPGVDKNHSAHA